MAQVGMAHTHKKHKRVQEWTKARTLNRIEHAFNSRYDSSRPSLISVCLTNDLILPRSSHLRTLLRIPVSTLVKGRNGSCISRSRTLAEDNNSSPFYLIHGLLSTRTLKFIRVVMKSRSEI